MTHEFLPKSKPFWAIIDALLADAFLAGIIGNKITLNPPHTHEFPLIFMHIVPPMLRKFSDDGSVLYYDEDMYIRLMVWKNTTKSEMEDIFRRIDTIVMNFHHENIVKIFPNKNNIFFDSDERHPYKSLEYGYTVQYTD